ncbi:hypothetical protein HK104_001235 [Borealophlyctis nickersoniae]|nr:hypothetical protein HK104_001235 [Borealophlyctis nickersoniae]
MADNSDWNFGGHEHYLGDSFDLFPVNLTNKGYDWLIQFRPKPSFPLAGAAKNTRTSLRVALTGKNDTFQLTAFPQNLGNGDFSDGYVMVPSNASIYVNLQLELTRKKYSPWTELLVGPLAKYIKEPVPIRRWILKQRTNLPGKVADGNELIVDGPTSPVTVLEETLTVSVDSVINSILSPFGVVAAIVAFFFGSGRYKPYGYAHANWYFRRRTADRKRFNIHPTPNGEYQTPDKGLEERMKVLEDRINASEDRIHATEELRELLLAEFLEVHESQINVRNDGGGNMGWAKVSDKVTEGEDQQLRAVRVEDC